MQANIVIVGATRGFETLTYSIPPALDGLIQPGIACSRRCARAR